MKALPKLILVLLLGSVTNIHSQDLSLDWVKGTSGVIGLSTSQISSNGEIYTTASYRSTIDIDPGSGVFNLVGDSNIFNPFAPQMFVQKLDGNGNLIWAKTFGSITGDESPRSIFIDRENNVYITGGFKGVCDFDPDTSVFNLTSTNSYSTFILKIDSSGKFLWAKSLDGYYGSSGNTIGITDKNEVLIGGGFWGTTDFDPSSINTFNVTATPTPNPGIYESDAYLLKLDTSGNFIWVKTISGNDGNTVTEIQLDQFGNIYSRGIFNGSADFDPDSATYNLNGSQNSSSMFIQKLDSNGNFVWAHCPYKGVNSNQRNQRGRANDMEVDSIGNIYLTGSFYDTTDFEPDTTKSYNLISNGNADIFIQKLNPQGKFIWAHSFGSWRSDYGKKIGIDKNNMVHVIGTYWDTVDFNSSNLVNKLGARYEDGFLLKVDSSGVFNYVKPINYNNEIYYAAIKFNSQNDLYMAGWFKGTVDFDFEPTTFNLTSSAGTVFLLKLNQLLTAVGLNQIELQENELKIFPNPSNDFIVINLPNASSYSLQIFNVKGKLVLEKFRHKNNSKIQLNLPSGVYHIRANDGIKNYSTTLIKR